MPPRPVIPADDLYARLDVATDASFETIEVAWRAQLKRHHPDVAGEHTIELAKRINVAHDWLSDPDLRARYDAERAPRVGPRGHSASRRSVPPDRPGAVRPEAPHHAHARSTTLERFLDRAARLTDDDIARLSVADQPPIAFIAGIRRFLSPDQASVLTALDRRVREAIGPRWSQPVVRDAVLAAGYELALAAFLDEHLSEPFRGRVRDRLTRAWDAAIDQPRYGPNTPVVRRFIDRVARLTDDEVAALSRAWRVAADPPWPVGIDPEEDEVFRVSVLLAGQDAARSADLSRIGPIRAGRARRVLAATAHAIVLRHAFTADAYEALLGPWRTVTGDPGTGRRDPDVSEPRVRRHA